MIQMQLMDSTAPDQRKAINAHRVSGLRVSHLDEHNSVTINQWTRQHSELKSVTLYSRHTQTQW